MIKIQNLCNFTNISVFVACEDGSIRLVGGQNAQEGTLELCSYSIWGLVAVSGWDEKDASVVCNELGFASQGNELVKFTV